MFFVLICLKLGDVRNALSLMLGKANKQNYHNMLHITELFGLDEITKNVCEKLNNSYIKYKKESVTKYYSAFISQKYCKGVTLSDIILDIPEFEYLEDTVSYLYVYLNKKHVSDNEILKILDKFFDETTGMFSSKLGSKGDYISHSLALHFLSDYQIKCRFNSENSISSLLEALLYDEDKKHVIGSLLYSSNQLGIKIDQFLINQIHDVMINQYKPKKFIEYYHYCLAIYVLFKGNQRPVKIEMISPKQISKSSHIKIKFLCVDILGSNVESNLQLISMKLNNGKTINDVREFTEQNNGYELDILTKSIPFGTHTLIIRCDPKSGEYFSPDVYRFTIEIGRTIDIYDYQIIYDEQIFSLSFLNESIRMANNYNSSLKIRINSSLIKKPDYSSIMFISGYYSITSKLDFEKGLLLCSVDSHEINELMILDRIQVSLFITHPNFLNLYAELCSIHIVSKEPKEIAWVSETLPIKTNKSLIIIFTSFFILPFIFLVYQISQTISLSNFPKNNLKRIITLTPILIYMVIIFTINTMPKISCLLIIPLLVTHYRAIRKK